MTGETDTFTYSDGLLETVSSGVWERWQTSVGNPGILNVVSNKLQNDATSTRNSIYIRNTTYASANVYTQWKFDTLGAGWEMGGFINAQDKGDATEDGYILACYDNGGGTQRQEIYKITNHSGTLLGSSGTLTVAAGDIGKLSHEAANVITGYLNGTVISGAGSTDSTYAAARVGIYMNSTGAGAWRLDDWAGGDIAAGPSAALVDIIGHGVIPIPRL